MEAIDDKIGRISKIIKRNYSDISNGYTFFKDGDVLFAKITPCMQNGKSAIAHNLIDGIGFGSTEFHVLRPKDKNEMTKEWIYYYLRTVEFRKRAENHFEGSAGQQRVSTHFLENSLIPIPPTLSDQIAIAADLERRMAQVEKIRRAALHQKEAAVAMKNAILREFFVSMKNDQWHLTKISQIAHIIMGQSPDGSSYNKEGAGIPLLNGPTEFGDEHPTPIQWTTSPKKLCHVGDLIVCVRGNTTGKMNWADQDYCLGRGVAGIRGKEEKGNTIFIKYALEYKINELLVGSERSTFPNLEKEELNSFEIFAPKDLFMQEKVAKTIKEKLETLNQLASSISSQVSAIEALPGAILREVFDFEEENIGD